MAPTPWAVDPEEMEPLVSCSACARVWHSPVLADGLREIGCCPRCGGTLAWSETAGSVTTTVLADPDIAPHLVLGVPRR